MKMDLTVLTVCAVGLLLLLSVWHSEDSPFDLRDLFLDSKNKVSLFKMGQVLALGLSSWGFVVLVTRDKLSEWYFFTYMATWAGMNIANKIVDMKSAMNSGSPPTQVLQPPKGKEEE